MKPKIAVMPRPSRFQEFLNKLPDQKRQEIEALVRTAPSTSQALRELKAKYRFKGSYDMLLTWRNAQKAVATPKRAESSTSGLKSAVADLDPIHQVKLLSAKLSSLSLSLIEQLEQHDWHEPGEIRLSNREATKLLGNVSSLSRSALAGVLEMYRVKAELNQKSVALALITELGEDWRRTLEHDNPELVPLFESVANVTRSRLQLDENSLLEVSSQQLIDSSPENVDS
jgi:hypothetical protein